MASHLCGVGRSVNEKKKIWLTKIFFTFLKFRLGRSAKKKKSQITKNNVKWYYKDSLSGNILAKSKLHCYTCVV